MNGLKIACLLLVSILLIILGWGYLAGMGIERTVLSTSYYADVLYEADALPYLHETIHEGLKQSVLDDVPEDAADIMQGAFAHAITQDRLGDAMLEVVDDLIALVRGEQDSFTATVDLRDAKHDFRSQLIAGFSDLSSDSLEELELAPDAVEEHVDEMMSEMDIPDELIIQDLIDDDMDESITAAVNSTQFYRNLLQIVPYLAFCLFLLICCLLAGISGGMKWFGVGLIAAGGTFSIGLMVIRSMLSDPFILVGEALTDAVRPELVAAIAERTISRLLAISIPYAFVGLAFVIVGIVIKAVLQIRAHRAVKNEPQKDTS